VHVERQREGEGDRRRKGRKRGVEEGLFPQIHSLKMNIQVKAV